MQRQTPMANPQTVQKNWYVVDATDIPKAADIGKVYAFATCDNTADARYVLFTYVLDTTATGLEGEVGLDANRNSTWFVDDLTAKE